MEILDNFKQNGYFTSELYQLLAKKKLVHASEEITPSEYEREMKMTTRQRLQNLNDIEMDNIISVTGIQPNKAVLSFMPKLLVFQNFKPSDKIVTKFSVKNISKGPTNLNMVFKESSYFFIKPCGAQLLSRLAPGISVTFAITFLPVRYEDYTHRVTFYTDVDQYVLPLIAMGPRPIFDFPDKVEIPRIPLKVENHVLMTIHNIGEVPAGFTLSCKCPFLVQPKSAYLNKNHKIDITLGFKTMHLGDTNGILNAIFETGEIFRIMLSGTTHTVSVELEKQVVRFFDTYNTMMRQQTYKVINKSDHVLTYMCMKNNCVYYDFEEKMKLAKIFYNTKESESAKYMKLVQYDVVSSNEHERVYTRIFLDEIQALVADESLLFQNTHFSIDPIKGKLWPNKTTELTITFCPKEIGEFHTTAYLDIDGYENRVPLELVGASLPPSICLNIETLDMDRVYINTPYHYEIVAINKGHINGVIVYKDVPPLFGSIISCSPELYCLKPGDKGIFIISFCNSNQGPYFEEINFNIRDTDVVLKLYLKGEVIYPSLTFSVPCLDFGLVSLGVPKTMELNIINESVVHVSGFLKMSSDGPEISSITLTDYAVTDNPKPEIPQWPREFNIVPCKADIEPESRISIMVTLTANLVRANQTSLELELEKSDSPPIVLPVMFNAMVPVLTPAPDINLRVCFRDFTYYNEIVIASNSFWGYFTLEESTEEESTLEVKVEIKEGFIEPNSIMCFPVSIKTSVLGVQEYRVRLKLFGQSMPIEICHITGCGVRPIVTCTPMAVHWGQIKLLTKLEKILTLFNDSPVEVNFTASLLSKGGPWQISPSEGYLEAESERDLTLTLYLIDAATYTNKVVLHLENVKDIFVPLSVTGFGTSILVDGQQDKIVLGRHFTKIPLECKVMVENYGTRMHALEWTGNYKPPKTKQPTAEFFNWDPRSFKISAGEKIELTVLGYSPKAMTIKETWYLIGSVEGINKKELLMTCQIMAEFVDPKIEVSSSVLEFQYDYGPYSEFYKLTDIITIKNVSKLPLDFEIGVKPPFAIIQKQSTYKIPTDEESMCDCIRYRKSDLNLQNLLSKISPHQSRTFIDYLTLKPVEPLRREPLHFFNDIRKIKMAFNFTHMIEERLEDQDVLKLQIIFDTTKHLSLKSRVYCDLMRVKFKGHKNKDAIKLIGRINFPNIFILTPRVDFQCVLNGSINSKTIKIQNATPLMVSYRFQWKKCLITKLALTQPDIPVDYECNAVSQGRNITEDTRSSRSCLHNNLSYHQLSSGGSTHEKDSASYHKIHSLFNDNELMRFQIIRKVTPMLDGDYDTAFEWIHKFSRVTNSCNKIDINDVFQLVLHRGLLKPGEVQYVHVIFRPKCNINVRAILECEVLGGPSETVIVTGQSSDLTYKISAETVNFKIRSFHEHAIEDLKITNTAQLSFKYKTYLNEPTLQNELEGTILELSPADKLLEPGEEIEVKIVIKPGVVGFFHRVFLLEIGHLPHIPIEIFGWGVIPQVYLTLHKPNTAAKMHSEIGYIAISSLTQEYLAAITEMFSKDKEEHLNSPLIEKCFDDPDFQADWHICSSWDGYPSTMDIELAIERLLVIDHIKHRPEILTACSMTSKMGPIPGFYTVPFVIDYGVVITGSTVSGKVLHRQLYSRPHVGGKTDLNWPIVVRSFNRVQCTAEVINYGPITTKIHFAKGTIVPQWLGLKLCGKLCPGDTGKLELTFTPTAAEFTEPEQDVETFFSLEVPYGVTIPIQIKALCAVPYLVSNVTAIDFGSVRCGNKVITSIPLKNVGKPTCIWYVTLKMKAPGTLPMIVLDSSGKYEPGEGGWLSVAFKPTAEMLYEGLLIFRFHMNPNKMTIPVMGQGIVPRVHIISPNVNFLPTLPWAETTEMYFGLTNPCPFPIELIVAHTDQKWNEEDEIFQLLYKFYNKPAEMLVPAIKPGVGLPPEVVNFYHDFHEKIKRAKEEEIALTRINKVITKVSASTKKTKSPKPSQKTNTQSKAQTLTPPIKIRTEAEIVADVMKDMKAKYMDPLKECLHDFDNICNSESSGESQSKGILIFFHGSPCEEMSCQEMAYSIGKHLGIPTINVDHSIVQALCDTDIPAKVLLVTAIEENYETIKRNMKIDSDVNPEHDEDFNEYEDEFEILLKKITFLAMTRHITTPRSKVSDKKKKKFASSSALTNTALEVMGSTTLFQMDLVEQLLTELFLQPKYHRGFVVDSLSSIVVKNPPLVLTTMIKCKRSIRNLHLVLCQSDFSKWAQAYNEAQREADILIAEAHSKVYDETEIQEILTSFEDMDAEAFDNVSSELKAIYITYGLESRREKYLGKVGPLSAGTTKKEKTGKETRSLRSIPETAESKKKSKKDETKGKPPSEYAVMNAKYNEYNKTTYEHLINIANNWIIDDCDVGNPLFAFNGQIVGATQKQKNKKKSDLQLQVSEVDLVNRGFPLTLLMCPCLRYKEGLKRMFEYSDTVRNALKIEEERDILLNPVNRKEFTVLLPKTFPTINHEPPLKWWYLDEMPIKKCECNQLTDLHLLDDSNEDNVFNILSKWHCTCGIKVASCQTSTREIPLESVEKIHNEESDEENELLPLPLSNVKPIPTINSRLVLQPGDLVRCKYTFSPQDEGNYSVKRFVEVSGWPESRDDINVNGICDLPRLDSRPKKMFQNFVRRTHEDSVYKLTYLDDLKVFEFGPLFVGYNRIYEEDYTIDLKNSSLMIADVVIEFLEDTKVFQLDKRFVKLEPGCREKLTISAAPAEVGVHTSVLLFCVKDNPEIVMVNITCSGVLPIVEILPVTKTIEYGKLLLYRREDDRFIVKNDSILPIMWKIRNAEDFVEDFIIAETSGIVPRYDNQVVPVTYIACRVGVISLKVLTIDIFDAEGRGEPMLVDNLSLSAECYDVMVECAHENPNENYLNYGNVKVNSTVVRVMYFLNRGKYNIYYKLKKVKNFPEPSLLRTFEAEPECGVIPATLKLVAIEFECTPTTSINLSNVPAYTCSLLDGTKNQVVVAKFPICVTIASFYNTFTLFPLGELNFHVIAVGTGITREVILNNTSKCPVTYEIVLPVEYQMTRDLALLPPPGKEKATKIRNPPLKCGNFLIMNEDNLLPPGTSRTIQIQFFATGARQFEETINFVISDTCPAEAQGVPLRLLGTGAMPTLDLWNIETTFREHLIVKNLSEYKVPESSPHCVFAENSVTFHFFCVTVHSSHMGSIDLYNNGLVTCVLSMKLHHQSNSNQKIFTLNMFDTHVEPLQHKNLGIIFTPDGLQEYRAVLEIKLKLLDNQVQSFKICLIGEGVIPRIELVLPQPRHQRIAVLQFAVTCLGSISNKAICFKNICSVNSIVVLDVLQSMDEVRPIFWLAAAPDSEHMVQDGNNDEINLSMKVMLRPGETITLNVYYNPIRKGRTSCDVKMTIEQNRYEYFNVLCEGESFMEDVILMGLEMLSMDTDLDAYKSSAEGTMSTVSVNKKSKTTSAEKRKSKIAPGADSKKPKRMSSSSIRDREPQNTEPSLLKYVLNYGGCELSSLQKRSVVMVNNSEKVYKFTWAEVDCLVIKPSVGYISPGEEKDLEIIFFSAQPITLRKEFLSCALVAISDDSLTLDMKGTTWDNRQIVTLFDHNMDLSLNQRCQTLIDEQTIPPSDNFLGRINMVIVYSAQTEYTKYVSELPEDKELPDTFIYQTSHFDFTVENVGHVPMKIVWSFQIDDEFPARIDKHEFRNLQVQPEDLNNLDLNNENTGSTNGNDPMPEHPVENDHSNVTLFSNSQGRDSVDTWFEVDLPFSIEPVKDCLKPGQSRIFKVTFSPLDAFDYKVRLKSSIDNLDPYDQNLACNLTARSVIPYVHLDIEASDYLTSGRRKTTGVALPPHLTVLEFNVLGPGCYKKTFNVINPTSEAYEFIFEMTMSDKPELIPVHCNMLKGYVEGGTSTEVTFTFSPTAAGHYESQWKFVIPVHNLVMNILVAGLVREPDVVFVPTILVIRNSLVGFETTNIVLLKNNETEDLKFEFKGNSLCNESGKTPVICDPNHGTLKPRSETPINIIYTPIQDGPLSYKIFCNVTYLTNFLTLCVNALSFSIKPKVTYYLLGNEHILNSEAITNIHLDQTASTYERTIPFIVKNDGSATFFFDWSYNISNVKKYMQLTVEPKSGHVTPANEVECTLYFTVKQVPVQAFPVTLSISDGPEYSIFIHAEIEKPLYHFSCKEFDFGSCFINAPDTTYKKTIAFTNDDRVPIIVDLNFSNLPELFVDYKKESSVEPGKRLKIVIYFRPKHVKKYEFTLQFWVNSLCEENIIIKGEGIPLLFDLYEGCQKSFDLGHVKVGEKITHTIEVMNHSKIQIEATFIFRDMYPVVEDTTKSDATSVCLSPMTAAQQIEGGPTRVQMLQTYKNDKVRDQIAMDIQNALSSLKVIPNKCTIRPFRKVPLKVQFKPVGLISKLNVQINMKVLSFERPLVRLSGCATGMSLAFSQNSLQFGRVRKRGYKVLKVMLLNKGDFGARFWWQPLITDEFTISPQYGTIAAHTNLTFTITFRPNHHNPFIKVWASCNIENYEPLELALYATCIDQGTIENKTLQMECPVRDIYTDFVVITNPTDDLWLILSEISGGPFETWKEFNVEPNSTLNIPVTFKPKSIGRHESQVLFSPLGESALFITLVGVAVEPNPNGTINISVSAKDVHIEPLLVYNITEFPESYKVSTEVVKINPEKFGGYYEIKCPETVKTWGEAAATCRWSFVCYEECVMTLKVMFINEETREFQYYNIIVSVTPSLIVDTLRCVCRARELVQTVITVKNPLANDAEYYIKCEKLQCPEVLKINRNSEAVLPMTYSPLVVGDTEDLLEVSNNLVGTFVYKVLLKCLPAKEKDMECDTSLGTNIPIRLRVQNKTGARANFICTVSHPSIQAEKEYALGPFEKGKFLVWFEPTELGAQNCKISFNSPIAGEFIFNIKGIGTKPKPRGPYDIKAGGSRKIVFKNIFVDPRIFKIYVDRDEFYVNTPYESIESKKDFSIQVSLAEKPITGWEEMPTGILTIENYEPPTPKVHWTYFLQGIP